MKKIYKHPTAKEIKLEADSVIATSFAIIEAEVDEQHKPIDSDKASIWDTQW